MRIQEITQYILNNFRQKTHRTFPGSKGFKALLQIVGGDKLIIPFADGAAHEPIQRPAFSA